MWWGRLGEEANQLLLHKLELTFFLPPRKLNFQFFKDVNKRKRSDWWASLTASKYFEEQFTVCARSNKTEGKHMGKKKRNLLSPQNSLNTCCLDCPQYRLLFLFPRWVASGFAIQCKVDFERDGWLEENCSRGVKECTAPRSGVKSKFQLWVLEAIFNVGCVA